MKNEEKGGGEGERSGKGDKLRWEGKNIERKKKLEVWSIWKGYLNLVFIECFVKIFC